MAIHRTAVVDPHAELDATVEVGAGAVVEGDVQIGEGSRIWPYAFIAGGARIGRRVEIHPFATVGHAPQDLAYDGSRTYAEIGDGCVIREHVSVHRGTVPGSSTRVGKRCYLMANSHVAHNCVLGDDVKLANGALLAGYVSVGDRAFLGGGVAVHQFTRVGELVMVRGLASVPMDVPSFMIAVADGVAGVNVIGLRRAGATREERADVQAAVRLLYRSGMPFRRAVAALPAAVRTDYGRRLVEFLQAPSKRGIAGLVRRGRGVMERQGDPGDEPT